MMFHDCDYFLQIPCMENCATTFCDFLRYKFPDNAQILSPKT